MVLLFVKKIKEHIDCIHTPVIFLSAAADNESIIEGFLVGGVDYILKPFNPYELLARVKNQINIKANFDNEMEKRQKEYIDTLNQLCSYKQGEHFNGHLERVANYSALLGFLCGFKNEKIKELKIGAYLHDIGKTMISDEILNKKVPLHIKEDNILKSHTLIAYEILGNSTQRVSKIIRRVVSQHHEKYNGTGYPNGITGNNIDFYARIVSLCDSFDLLTTKRGAKEPWSLEDSKNFIKYESGKSFDPELVTIFLENFDEFEKLYNKNTKL